MHPAQAANWGFDWRMSKVYHCFYRYNLLLCPEAAEELQAYGEISAKMTLFIVTTPSK